MPSDLYIAYGLSIRAELPLPELMLAPPQATAPAFAFVGSGAIRDGQAADIVVRVLEHPGSRPTMGEPLKYLGPSTDVEAAWHGGEDEMRIALGESRLAWGRVGRFTLWAGREVVVEPTPGVDEKTLRACLLGPVLAALLYQRGFLVLHSSAVALPGPDGKRHAVAFVGNSGEGKSTMAAALHARGHSVVADDFIAVPPAASTCGASSDSPAPIIFPGFPRLRLWPPSLEALGEDVSALPSVHPGGQKRARAVEREFQAGALPLRRIYVLSSGASIRSHAVSPSRAAIELVQHGCCTGLLAPAESARHFQACAALAGRVSVRQLERPRDLAMLAQVAQAVEDDQAPSP